MALIKVQCTIGDTSSPSSRRINIHLNDDVILAVIEGKIILKEKYRNVLINDVKLSSISIENLK